jgi:hypothetical protein
VDFPRRVDVARGKLSAATLERIEARIQQNMPIVDFVAMLCAATRRTGRSR